MRARQSGNGHGQSTSVRIVRFERTDTGSQTATVPVGAEFELEVEIVSSTAVECGIRLSNPSVLFIERGKVSEVIGPKVEPVRRVWVLRAVAIGDCSISVRVGTQLCMQPVTIVGEAE